MSIGIYDHQNTKTPIYTKERNRKISIFNKGQKYKNGRFGYWKNKKLSLEHKNKIKNTLKNKHISPSIKFKKGKDNPSWKNKGHISTIRKRIEGSLKYKKWHQEILIRDDFTCQKCMKRGGKLEIHHLKSFKNLLKEIEYNLPLFDLYNSAMIYTPFWDIDNGETLCKDCHKNQG